MNTQTLSASEIAEVISHFCIEGSIAEAKPFGSGHINDTFRLKNENENHPDYLLQRVNHNIFKDVHGMMNNIKEVTEHLRKKLSPSDVHKKTMTIVPNKDGSLFYKDKDGNYWRMFYFIKDTNSYDVLENEKQAYAGGVAFGRFQLQLADLDPTKLVDTIPKFLNIQFRLDQFHQAIEENKAGRIAEVADVIKYLQDREERMKMVLKLGTEGKIPLRITHNDTKFNNVLLDKNDNVQCVIDLDTVMPGYIAYDFGDAIRTIINSTTEDQADLSKVKLNIPLFEAYTKGYYEEAGKFLTPLEIDTLIMGVELFPYMQTVRFLTDYLNGDTYYKIAFEKHNLQRTFAQLQLLKEIEAHFDQLKGIIDNIFKK